MLANVIPDSLHDLSDYWVSEKLDGVRAYWTGEQLLTRADASYSAFFLGGCRTPM